MGHACSGGVEVATADSDGACALGRRVRPRGDWSRDETTQPPSRSRQAAGCRMAESEWYLTDRGFAIQYILF